MDTSNRNNLVFYGVKEEADTPDTLVKEVIRRSDCCCDVYYVIFIVSQKPSCGKHLSNNTSHSTDRQLAIIRDIPLARVRTCEGSNVRGTQPITVTFQRYQVSGALLQENIGINLDNIHSQPIIIELCSIDFMVDIKCHSIALSNFHCPFCTTNAAEIP